MAGHSERGTPSASRARRGRFSISRSSSRTKNWSRCSRGRVSRPCVRRRTKGSVGGQRGKRGVATLRRVLDIPGGPKRTRSSGERAMLRLLRRAGMTGFETNARIHGYEVDFLWRGLGVAVELDGWDGHSGRIAFERDRLKVAKLTAHGVTAIPVTGRQLRDDPAGVVDRLTCALTSARTLSR